MSPLSIKLPSESENESSSTFQFFYGMKQFKNILVLTGSPRRGGNSSLLADAFISGAQNAGHTVNRFDAGHKNIKPCMACDKCFSKDAACVFNDDFNDLSPLLEEAEVIVFITPMYWFSFPSQMKTAIDKMYSLLIGKKEMKNKESMLLVCAGTNDMSEFDSIVRMYESINRYMEWNNKGMLLVPNVNEPGDIRKTDALEKAEQMGKNISRE